MKYGPAQEYNWRLNISIHRCSKTGDCHCRIKSMCLQKPNVRILGCVHTCSFDLLVQTKGGKVWLASIKPWFAWCSRWHFQQQTKGHDIKHVFRVRYIFRVIQHTGIPAVWSISPNFQGWLSWPVLGSFRSLWSVWFSPRNQKQCQSLSGSRRRPSFPSRLGPHAWCAPRFGWLRLY